MEKTPWLEPSLWSERAKSVSDLKISYQLSFLLRWHQRIFATIWASLFVAIMLLVYVRAEKDFGLSEDSATTMIMWLLVYAVWAAITQSALAAFARYKLSSFIVRTRGQICPKCFYDLSARPRDNDTCPECGLNAPRRECVRLWCKLLRSRF